MSVIGGQNTPTTNGLAYIIDFNNNYISGSSTVTPILYLPTASQFTGSVPNLVNGQVQFTGSSVLRSFQTFPGFSAVQGNMTLMFSGESKNSNVLFTQDGTVAVVSTTSSIGYGVPAGNLGRNFPNTGFDHVTLRFSSASVDCFVNGIPVSASGMFPTVPSSSTFNDFKIGGNYINAWTGSFSGSLGQLMVYNRVLSDDEIYSNYLIQARRYGLPEIPKPYTVDSSVYVYTLAAGITGSSTISALNTFVSGLKTAGLWDKMIAIYPFIGTSPSGSRLNLKDVSLNTTQVNYSGSWSTSLSGSYNNNTASYGILSNITPTYVHPLINSQSIHLSYLSYDTPVSGGYLMGAEQLVDSSVLPGDVAQPAAAYSVRKVRTAYTGSCMDVRRDLDNTTGSIGFDGSGNLDTGSLLAFVTGSAGTGSGFVTRWYDQSGNDRHMLQPTATFQPLIVSSGSITIKNNKPALGFDGSTTKRRFEQIITTAPLHSTFTVLEGTSTEGSYKPLGSFNGGSSGLNFGANASADILETVQYRGSGITLVCNTDIGVDQQVVITLHTSTNSRVIFSNNTPTRATRDIFTSQPILNYQIGKILGQEGYYSGKLQELVFYSSSQIDNTSRINSNINNYYNAYTPFFNSNNNSLSLFTSPKSLMGGTNTFSALLTTGGPIGLVTVSRTGSSSYTLWKNLTPLPISLPPSTASQSEIYLNAVNINNTLFSSSQNNISYASVGAGLSNNEVRTYYQLVSNFQNSLGRQVSNPNALITIWDTTQPGSANNTLILPLASGLQAITASWGDGTVSLISSSIQIDRTHSYTEPGVYTVTITGTGSGLNPTAVDRNKLMDIAQFGSFPIIDVGNYNGCISLTGTATDAPVIQTTNLSSCFNNACRFNGIVNGWNTLNVTDMNNMFNSAVFFNQNVGAWNVEKVTNMSSMFIGRTNGGATTIFNNGESPDINNWRPISCSNFSSMFQLASLFNQPIGNWTIGTGSQIPGTGINMSNMFNDADAFNQNIGTWNVEKVTNMSSMFTSNTGFNNSGSSDINNWRPISCSNFSSMFQSATAFNQPIGGWQLPTASNIAVTMSNMFFGATSFNQNLGSWDVSKITNMGLMLYYASAFNNSGSNSINNWRPISCSNFSSMFEGATTFNQPIGNWTIGTGSQIPATGINMSSMFRSPTSFNQNIGAWNVEKVTNMSSMFNGNGGFNNSGSSDINNWRPISCSNFTSMFEGATAFNQPIGNWPLSASNIQMNRMFASATSFNQTIGNLNTTNVTNMSIMFYNAQAFNQDISTKTINAGQPNEYVAWDMSNVTNIGEMFRDAYSFNQDISNWDTSNVTSMLGTFQRATAFNRDIGNWNVGKVTNFSNFMESKTTYSFLHTIYDGWINNKLQPQRTITFNTIKYSGSAAEGRALLSRTYNTASITGYSNDGGNMAITCSVNHNVIVGNKIFISGSSFAGINGVQTVLVAGSPTTLTLNTIYDPTATGGTAITGYGWSIADGGVV